MRMRAQRYQHGRVPRFKKGGKVQKTGLAIVEKGERVLTKKQQKSKKQCKAKR
jgi:hypothetical protein